MQLESELDANGSSTRMQRVLRNGSATHRRATRRSAQASHLHSVGGTAAAFCASSSQHVPTSARSHSTGRRERVVFDHAAVQAHARRGGMGRMWPRARAGEEGRLRELHTDEPASVLPSPAAGARTCLSFNGDGDERDDRDATVRIVVVLQRSLQPTERAERR